MNTVFRVFLSCCFAISLISCGASNNGGGAISGVEGLELKTDPINSQNAQNIDFDGTQTDFQLGLRDDVMKEEWVEVPYQDTCVRQVPDGFETICETRYRDEQKCDYEQVCTQEQECHIEQECHNQQQCTSSRECHIETQCSNQQVCHDEQQCHNQQQCSTHQECTSQPVCHDDRQCEIVNGERVCTVQQVCTDQQSCRPVQECHDEQVCQNRPVCHNEQSCRDERVCVDVPQCDWVPVCRDNRVCNYVPKCRNEYLCHNVSVPYQDCQQQPRYRDEYYSCTKTHLELQSVLDYHHVVDVKVVFDGVSVPQGARDQLRIVTQNGLIDLQVVQVSSGLVYYHTISSKTQNVGVQDKLTTTLITIRAVEASASDAAKILSVRSDKVSTVIERQPTPLLPGFDLKVRLKIKRDTAVAATLVDRDLLPKEYQVAVATSKSQVITVTLKDLKIEKEAAKKGSYTVESQLRLEPMAPWQITEPSPVQLKSSKQTIFKN